MDDQLNEILIKIEKEIDAQKDKAIADLNQRIEFETEKAQVCFDGACRALNLVADKVMKPKNAQIAALKRDLNDLSKKARK